MVNKKVIFCLIILCLIVFVLGMHGGSEYYFRDFCVHKMLNMFYNSGNPEFFKKPNFVPDVLAPIYGIFYLILKNTNVVSTFDQFVRYFPLNSVPTPVGNIPFTLPALVVNNLFGALGVCFTFLTTYILTDKKIIPSFISGFLLATSFVWMDLSHHLAVDLPLTSIIIILIFFAIYFIKNKTAYSYKNVVILGILCGLCAATKYNGAYTLIVPLSVILFTEKSKKEILSKYCLLFLCSISAFLLTNPHILIKFGHFYSDFLHEYNHAFVMGHHSVDDIYPRMFYIFHSFPNSIGGIPFIISVIGMILFIKDKSVEAKEKIAFLSFPITFFILMGLSKIVFLRYILPVVPFLTVLIGWFINYFWQIKSSKLLHTTVVVVSALLIIQNSLNAFHFYNVWSLPDTRVAIKNVFKSLNINSSYAVSYTDIFSNPYYEEDFLSQYPYLYDDVKKYLYDANNKSIELYPRRTRTMMNNYNIVIFDSSTYDRSIQVRKDPRYARIANQYFMYNPFRKGVNYFEVPNVPLYVVEVNPYKISKFNIPFNFLRSDVKYRTRRGPFVEIYFRDKALRDKFTNECYKYSLQCLSMDANMAYYYNNIMIHKGVK